MHWYSKLYKKYIKLNQNRIAHFVKNPLSKKPYKMIFVGPGSVKE
jgi:hypothetical protein